MDLDAAPVQAAVVALVSAQVVMIVQVIVQTWNAREQRQHDRDERKNQQKHDADERQKQHARDVAREETRRAHERRLDVVRMHREAIAHFRREYSRYSEFRDEDLSHNMRQQERSIRDPPVEEPKERREIMRELAYWTTLLPTDVQRAARVLLVAHDKSSWADARLWASSWMTPADIAEGAVPPSGITEAFTELRDAYQRFDQLATAWIEAHALADEIGAAS